MQIQTEVRTLLEVVLIETGNKSCNRKMHEEMVMTYISTLMWLYV